MAAMIGAPHGVKRPADLGDVSAEAFQHRTDNAVALYDDTVLFDLGWQMAIAQVPSQLAKVQAIARGDGIELFIRGDDLYLASVFQNQEIAIMERNTSWCLCETLKVVQVWENIFHETFKSGLLAEMGNTKRLEK